MTTITSQVHSETIAGWSPIGPLVSGMGSSLAFTILTGLAERRVFPLPSAFRTGYGPRCLSAQGKSRDLQHLSPMLTRCGNSALRDMAHMGVSPIDTCIPHKQGPPSFGQEFLERRGPFTVALKARLSNECFARNEGERSTIFPNQSSCLDTLGFRSPQVTVHMSKCTACSGPLSSGLVSSLP